MKTWLRKRWPLLAVVAGSLIIRLPLLCGPFGGLHGYNEAFYALGARIQAGRPLLEMILRPIDLNNLPLFSWLVTGAVKLAGSQEHVIRAPSLVAALATIYLAGVLAERVGGSDAAVPAALFVSLAPAALIIGMNAQPDSLMIALALGGMVAWLAAYPRADAPRVDGRSRELGFRILSGVLFGLSALAKLNGILVPLAIVLWETARHKGLRWARRGSVWPWAALWVGFPASWFVLQTIVQGPAALAAQRGLSATAEAPRASFLLASMNELAFQIGPPVALVAVAGLVAAAAGRSKKATVLLVWVLAVQAVFYAAFHYHSYYLLTFTVTAAIVAAVALARFSDTSRVLVIGTALLVMLTTPFDVLAVDLKLPHTGERVACSWMVARAGSAPTVVLPKGAYDSNRTQFLYYAPRAQLRETWSDERAIRKTRTFALFSHIDPAALPSGAAPTVAADYALPVVFGWAITAEGPVHSFLRDRFVWTRVGPWWRFGTERRRFPIFGLADVTALSPEARLRFKEQWQRAEGAGPDQPGDLD